MTQAKENRAGWVQARGPEADTTFEMVGVSQWFSRFCLFVEFVAIILFEPERKAKKRNFLDPF